MIGTLEFLRFLDRPRSHPVWVASLLKLPNQDLPYGRYLVPLAVSSCHDGVPKH
jgi:hypothetical protein